MKKPNRRHFSNVGRLPKWDYDLQTKTMYDNLNLRFKGKPNRFKYPQSVVNRRDLFV